MNTLQLIKECQEKIISLEKMVGVSLRQRRIEEIDSIINSSKIWSDPKGAAGLMKERLKLSDLINKMQKFIEQNKFNLEFSEACPEDLDSLSADVSSLYEEIIDFEFKQMLSRPTDDAPAILAINAGAGGLEAANWVTMLFRMYSRYAISEDFTIELLDEKKSDEHSAICTDSISIRIDGKYAYGFFKGESGVHRLIRNSPFNAADARQTSFAAVQVTPDIEDLIDIKIDDKDIEISAQTAGGPGGQNVNKVASAIRLKHIPSGINILVRNERDQLSNKKTAFKILKAKLYDIELKKKQETIDKQISELSNVSFGHQIRTYIESPYALVSDHRSGCKINQFDSVLDGNIKELIIKNLQQSILFS